MCPGLCCCPQLAMEHVQTCRGLAVTDDKKNLSVRAKGSPRKWFHPPSGLLPVLAKIAATPSENLRNIP